MKIASVPLEAYRQAGDVNARKANAGHRNADAAKTASQSKSITLPGKVSGETDNLKVHHSPALLRSVLSTDEKDTLVQYFARFGDSSQTSQLYDPNARVGRTALTGQKVDFKG
ncbi:MAG: hypothetical protein GY841_09825 [FCB group bacterium]|nr:hypothetical protein [FCB group bacterium]